MGCNCFPLIFSVSRFCLLKTPHSQHFPKHIPLLLLPNHIRSKTRERRREKLTSSCNSLRHFSGDRSPAFSATITSDCFIIPSVLGFEKIVFHFLRFWLGLHVTILYIQKYIYVSSALD